MFRLNNFIAIFITIIVLLILFSKKIRTAELWRATVTPLASIIGSGFLVSAPLLLLATGKWASPVMCAIVLLAYGLGSSIRFNIQHVEPLLSKPKNFLVNRVETISRFILGIAYIISVAFYLKLLSAFALRGLGFSNILVENSITTVFLLFIGIMGKVRGLSMLELLETYSVNTKLAIICAIIATFFLYNIELITKGEWIIKVYAHESWWIDFRKVLGMIIIIQGFETSRFLGDAHSKEIRIKTMRYAQLLSGGIYVLFVALSTVIFNDIHHISETTVIDLCRIVAPVLPILLVIAALMSQFSAAVADTLGSGGLLNEATHQKVTVENSYLIISLIAISLTWFTDIYQIITIASKAFAIYYAFEISLTLLTTKKKKMKRLKKIHSTRIALYVCLLVLMIAVVILGIPAE